MTEIEIERELLYGALINLGNIYPLNRVIEYGKLEEELEPFAANWVQYNPRKPKIARQGLSLTSLDGGLSGRPDLDSLYEYNRENGTEYDEASFVTPTRVLRECASLSEPLATFIPHLGRSHLIRLDEGGYFPFHRDSQGIGAATFRLIALLSNCGVGQLCFTHGDRRLFLEQGLLYFMNTKMEHALISFGPGAKILVLNVRISRESVDLVHQNLVSR